MVRTAAGLRGSWLRLGWGRLRVWRGGDGPTLLAVHGLGGSGRYFDALARSVGDRYEVLAPDLAGFGRSDKPRVDYSRAFHVENLDEAVDRFGDARLVTVVGHSLGGVLGALWAAEHVERVRALVLLATPFPEGAGPPAWAQQRPRPGFRAAAIAARAAWPVVGVPIGVARGYPPGVVMDFGRQNLHSRLRTMASVLWDPGVADELERVRAIPSTVPVLLANARDDRTVPFADQERWAALLPHAQLRALDEGGHQFPLRSGFATASPWLNALAEG